MNVEAAEAAPGRRAKVTTDSLSPRPHQELSDLASGGPSVGQNRWGLTWSSTVCRETLRCLAMLASSSQAGPALEEVTESEGGVPIPACRCQPTKLHPRCSRHRAPA